MMASGFVHPAASILACRYLLAPSVRPGSGARRFSSMWEIRNGRAGFYRTARPQDNPFRDPILQSRVDRDIPGDSRATLRPDISAGNLLRAVPRGGMLRLWT